MPKKKQLSLEKCLEANTEEEVKNIFSKYFDFDLDTSSQIDAYTENCLFEFKYDRNFSSVNNRAKTVAQALHYIHRICESGLIPDYICIANYKQACYFQTDMFEQIYLSEKLNGVNIWDTAPNNPCSELIEAVKSVDTINTVYIYEYSNEADIVEFSDIMKKILKGKGTRIRQKISPGNIDKVWTIWSNHFGEYVNSDRQHKPTFYFYIDIQKNRTFVVEETGNNLKICFLFDEQHGDSKIVFIPTAEYNNFWNRFKKIEDQRLIDEIQQKIYRLEKTDIRKFQGMFYTPKHIASRGFEYLENVLGKDFWKNGKYRFWDMCAGTGNLQYDWPNELIQYCYLSTIEADEISYCRELFPNAKAIFQYDYLNDDVDTLIDDRGSLFPEYSQIKKPQSLINDLNNPDLKWIVFINPPYAEATANVKRGEKRKDGVNSTNINSLMSSYGLSKPAKELYCQFLFRILKEFPKNRTILGMYSTPKYMISSDNKDFRNNFFHPEFKGGFVVNSREFSQCKGEFPITFAIWDLSKNMDLKSQKLSFDVVSYTPNNENIKSFIEPDVTINNWFVREKNTKHMVPFSSAITEKKINPKDNRDRIADGFIGFIASGSPDVQNNNLTCILSAPSGGNFGTSMTKDNYEKSLIINTVRNLVTSNWLNNRDQYSVPLKPLDNSFVNDSIIWSLFSISNQTASIRDVVYMGEKCNVINNFFPFKKSDLGIQSRIEDSFISNQINYEQLSHEAKMVYDKGKEIYKYFFENIDSFDLRKYRIDKIDYRIGWYQIRNAILNEESLMGNNLINGLKDAMRVLSNKLIPQIYEYGFLPK